MKVIPSPFFFPTIQNAIANASTLAEVERLKGLLQSGQIPGRERRSGQETVFCLNFQVNGPLTVIPKQFRCYHPRMLE